MGSSAVFSYSAALTEALNRNLLDFLVRDDEEEDLVFALYTPSEGKTRLTALVHTIISPGEGDRQRHGNVSFNRQYLERVCQEALSGGYGVVFLHSHPHPGWQHMSRDDIHAETRMAQTVHAVTGLPLLGMTVGNDGTWSARIWEPIGNKPFERRWCESVRVVGKRLTPYFADSIIPPPTYQELFKRTATVWGEAAHQDLARLRVGIVGLGSVGSLVAESLARMGMSRLTFIDFDVIEPHNLDRLLGATVHDIGVKKVEVAQRQARASATAKVLDVQTHSYSLAEPEGYEAALVCDVLFCCVDRPRARSILNHFAYAHLIPVIDGGIDVRFKEGHFSGVDWQVQTVGVDRPCLECLERFDPGDVETERAGLLDDATYLRGLPQLHHFKRNENVFPFSMNLASLEILQFIALATGTAGLADFGVQRYHYIPGILESDSERTCRDTCPRPSMTAQGDKLFALKGRDIAAERSREQPSESA